MIGSRILVALGVAMTCVMPVAAQPTLKYKFKANETLIYSHRVENESLSTVKMKDKDKKVKVANTLEYDILWKVLSVDDKGAAKIKWSIDRARMTFTDERGTRAFDSESKDEPNDLLSRVAIPLVRQFPKLEATLTMLDDGSCKDIVFPANMFKELANLPEAQISAEMMLDKNLQKLFTDSAFILGDTAKGWKKEVNHAIPIGNMNGTANFTYKGPVDRAGAKLEQIDMAADCKISPYPNNLLKVEIKKCDGKGVVYFDATQGRLSEVQSSQTVEGEIIQDTGRIPVVQTSNVTLKLREVKAGTK